MNEDYIKIGSLVRGKSDNQYFSETRDPLVWTGIVIGYQGINPIVFWSEKFPAEVEYTSQLELLS
ncbi:MAG: hypothetical protein CML56_04635 [Rhodobacteraceae bacterium]|nr:hypothetical protein [Paracoccaceae bacterium]